MARRSRTAEDRRRAHLLNQISANAALMHGAAGLLRRAADVAVAGSPPARSRRPASTTRATSRAPWSAWSISIASMPATTRVSVGAVNVRTGNFVYFDTTTHTIRPEHVMASGALPPGFPAVEIEGEHYWDGGLVSNTPLQWVAESQPRRDTLAFQVDLWSARGELPRDMLRLARGKRRFAIRADPRQHRPLQARPEAATRGVGTARPTPCGRQKQSGGEAARRRGRSQGLWPRPADLSRPEPRGPLQVLRVLPARAWRSTGAPATTMPSARCVTRKCWSDPTTTKASRSSTFT